LATKSHFRSLHTTTRRAQEASKPVIEIRDATFYRRYPSAQDSAESNPALFPGLNFSLPNTSGSKAQYWSVLSPSSLARTTFLQVLAGQHICIPPTARSYPHLSEVSESPQHAIKYVGFDAERGSNVGGTNVRGAYLSARYESRREDTDYSVLDYLTGNTELNAIKHILSSAEKQTLEDITEQLNLRRLLTMPVAHLSNGQTRRARIAKALMARPEVLLLDGPFMGLDPNTLTTMSRVLHGLAERQQPRLIMSLRPEDGVPDWVDHLVVVNDKLQLLAQEPKKDVFARSSKSTTNANLIKIVEDAKRGHQADATTHLSRDGFPRSSPALTPGEALVEMNGVHVSYGEGTRIALGDWIQTVNGEQKPGLWWSLHRGQRCGIFGPNGSGKTTMLSLITSDHPQTYSLPIKLFGRSRLPGPGQPGISLFDIQRRMGHSSPEVHAFFPKGLTVRRAVQSAWADAPMSKPKMTDDAKKKVDACLRWFASELQPRAKEDLAWADDVRFAELSFSNQRLVLFLRAIVSNPDLVILDEALSGIDEATRDKALLFLSHGEKIASVTDGVAQESEVAERNEVVFSGLHPEQALLVISHAREDVPGCLREWICLPEPGEGRAPRAGTLPGPLELNPRCWDEIWGR
jgi:ABC-type molybdenum transport system ATPase subunit/photorepair protein PhrA